jgi:hypothetical protein
VERSIRLIPPIKLELASSPRELMQLCWLSSAVVPLVIQLKIQLANGIDRDMIVGSVCPVIQGTCHPKKNVRD